MNIRLFVGLVIAAVGSGTFVPRSFGQAEEYQTGVPVRIWAQATNVNTYQVSVQEMESTTFTPILSGWSYKSTLNRGGKPVFVWRRANVSFVTAAVTLAGSFLPWSSATSGNLEGVLSNGVADVSATTTAPGQAMQVDLGIVRVVPGKSYTLNATLTNAQGTLIVAPPPGFRVVMNNMARNACPLAPQITFRLVGAGEGVATRAGHSTTAANSGVDWRLSLGGLLNGESAGYVELSDTGIAADLSALFAPSALSYEASSSEVFVHRENNAIRQIIANQVALDVIPLGSGSGFQIRCFNPNQIKSYVPCSFSGSPFAVYKIERGPADPLDSTAVEIKFTREVRDITDPNAENVAVARTDEMKFRRAGVAPSYHWSKVDWTQLGQAPLVGTAVHEPASAPVFTLQPFSQAVAAGATCALTVAVSGYPVPTYVWKRNGTIVADAQSPTLQLTNVQSGTAGNYTVTATNASGSATSAVASVALKAASSAPVITAHPAGRAVSAGRVVMFSVTAEGATGYQWKKNNVAVPGALAPTFGLPRVAAADAGTYSVTVSNGSGSVDSQGASLTVLGPRTEILEVATPNAASGVAFSASVTYSPLASGEQVVSQTVGTSNPLTTLFDYYTDINQPGSFGYLKGVTLPGGGWEEYEYYDSTLATGYQMGQVKHKFRPFGSTSRANKEEGEKTFFEYATDAHGARTRLLSTHTYVMGVQTARSAMAYSSAAGYSPYVQNSVLQTRTDYTTDTASTSTKTAFYPENETDAFLRGRPIFSERPDGTKETYVYQRGGWDGAAFTLNSNGNLAGRVTVISGTKENPGGAAVSQNNYAGTWMALIWLTPGRSTAESTVRDERALVVRTESLVWTAGGWQLVSFINFNYDPMGQLVGRVSSNGGIYSANYSGMRKKDETDERGITIGYLYDASGRVSVSTRAGAGDIGSLSTRFTYDATGKVLEQRIGVGLSEQLVTTRAYDHAGRLVAETAPGIASITHAYDVANRTHTVSNPDGGTILETAMIDGRPASKRGSAVVAEYFSYGVDPISRQLWTQVNRGTADSKRWRRTYRDGLGREHVAVAPIFGSTSTTFDGSFNSASVRVTRNHYNDTQGQASTGKVWKITDVDIAATLYDYDPLGQRLRSGLDVNGNQALDLALGDRISESSELIEQHQGHWWATTTAKVYAQQGSGSVSTMSVKRKRLTGHLPNRLEETQETDVNGNVTTTVTDVQRSTATVTTTTSTSGVGRAAVQTAVLGLVTRVVDTAGITTAFRYDSLGRRTSVTDGRLNVSKTTYVPGTTLVYSVSDTTATLGAGGVGGSAGVLVAIYGYDTSGRRTSQAGAPDPAVNGNPRHYTYTGYDQRGNVVRTWGGAAIPTEFAYDLVFGERTTMRTFRGGTGWEGPTWPTNPGNADPTTWTFDPATGLLLSKTDASGKAVSYTYNKRGQLETRRWARVLTAGPNAGQRVTTTYVYDPVTTEQRDVVYNDGTKDLHYYYNRMGQLGQVEDVTGSRILANCLCGKLSSEQLSATFFGPRKLVYKLADAAAGGVLGRTLGYALLNSGAQEQDLTYHYDPMSGRFSDLASHSTFAAAEHSFVYGYEPGTSLIKSMTVDSGSTFRVTREFEADRDVLTRTSAAWNGMVRTQYDYVTDDLGQRSSVKQSGNAFADYEDGTHTSTFQKFGYDARGQLTSATTYLGATEDANKIMQDRQHVYAYDNIGNRQSSNHTGNATLRDDYGANNLNQYTFKENNVVTLSGTVLDSATKVEVAGRSQLAARQGRYWNDVINVMNEFKAWRGTISIYTGKKNAQGTSPFDLVRTDVRLAQIPPRTQSMSYDEDGNLLNDGVWDYRWDAENRLVRMTATTDAVSGGYPNHRLEFLYDYQGRRVQKLVFDHGTGQLLSARRFVYEGWNLIAELALNASLSTMSVFRTYTWGLDIVHDLAKSGGVGALLQMADHRSGKAYFPSYDGNGNIVAWFNGAASGGSAGALAAVYEYSPYGEPLRTQTFDDAIGDQPFRFSTKYTDETGLVYYGRRYYSPSQGRFLGRDTKGEAGGLNLFAFVRNSPANRWDYLGMFDDGMCLDPLIMTHVPCGTTVGTGMDTSGMMSPVIVSSSPVVSLSPSYDASIGISVAGGPVSPSGGVVGLSLGSIDIKKSIDEALGLRLLTPEELAGAGELGLYYFQWNANTGKFDAYAARSVLTQYAFVNGVTGNLQDHVTLAQNHIALSFGLNLGTTLTSFTLFNNPTNGLIFDLFEATADKLGFTSAPAKALASVLQATQAAGHSTTWIAHSQGGAIFSQAMNYSASNGVTDLSVNSVRFNAGANNWLVTNSIAAGVHVNVHGYYGSPLDPVPNTVGLNGNPITIPLGFATVPLLFLQTPSPHTQPRSDWYLMHQGTGAMGPFPPVSVVLPSPGP